MAAGTVAFAVTAPAAASLISNGGFEGPTFSGTFAFLNGVGDLSGWTFAGDLQDEPSYWWNTGHGGNTRFAAEGNAAIMLNRGDRISQSFTTIVGQSYSLSFHFQRLEATTLEVLVAGSTYNLGANDGVETSMIVDTRFVGYNWREITLQFTATSSTTALEFFGAQSPTGSGWYLDDVVVDAVPAPGVLALMSLAGFVRVSRRAR
ncbi:MAG: hypothetical protein RL591_1293 [Planctomycetota bacterium]